MHLGLNRRALCAPYRIMGAVAPRLKILMTSGSKKGTQIYYVILSKVPANKPLQVAQRGPYGERYSPTGHLHISKGPNKNSSNKKASRKKHPSMFPKSGAPMEIDAHSQTLLNISYSSPVKEPRSPPSSIFQSPRYMNLPPRHQAPLSTIGGPVERDAHIRRLSGHIFRGLQ